jgi:hypothetical protein
MGFPEEDEQTTEESIKVFEKILIPKEKKN